MSRSQNIVLEIVQKMKASGLGIKRKTVVLKDSNEQWPEAFQWIKSKLLSLLNGEALFKIEHFGSTSIPGIMAKPVLDVMIIFNTDCEIAENIPRLESLGFIYKGDAVSKVQLSEADPGRHFFSFYDMEEEIDYIHLHVFFRNHPDVSKNLDFRDKLRCDAILAQKYEDLKKNLMNSGLMRSEYTRTKSQFISEVVQGQPFALE